MAALIDVRRSVADPSPDISTEVETTLLEPAQTLGVRTAFGRARQITRSCLDPKHAERLLGWCAAMPLAEGLRETVRHAAAA